MKVEDVKKLSPLQRFCYWIEERHTIHLRRKSGQPKPWTDDEILQTVFFTNPYRENDKVTVWFRENIREPLRDDPAVLMATIIFRWFNWPPTANILAELPWTTHEGNLLLNWDREEALTRLREARDRRKEQIFTGAFMINSPPGKPKLEAIVERIDNVWKDRDALLRCITSTTVTMERAHEVITRFDGLGGFMAYEIVCDLRYTYLLEDAPDKLSWCNPGPGAVRGLYRIFGRDFPKGNNSSSPPVPKDWKERTAELLALSRTRFPDFPPFEMREVEHSLCEFDKYERILWGDGKAKRGYNGAGKSTN